MPEAESALIASRARDLIYDWNTAGQTTTYPAVVELNDETLRDGLQSPSVVNPPVEQKIDLLRLMGRLGIHCANIGYASSSRQAQQDVVALACASVGLDIHVNVAARTTLADIVPAIECAQQSGVPVEVAVFVGSSPIRRLAEDWDFEDLVMRVHESVDFVVKHGQSCMFVTEDTTRADPESLERLYSVAIGCGARRICIADTTGHATPDGARNVVTYVRRIVQQSGAAVAVDWHGHSDRGLAVANSLAAIAAGVDRVHATALGIGERSGNTPMDTLLVNLKLLGVLPHDMTALNDYVRRASHILRVPIPAMWPVFSPDAFRTATGVHASAVSKALARGDQWLADHVYCSVPAEWFGRRQIIEVGPLSGASNVVFYLKSRGIDPVRPLVDRVLAAAKRSHRVLREDEIMRIVNRRGPEDLP
ncbi:MAG: 2-isopropylmalate synthase [Chloroflexi bacterium]|nr:2-isopropylmalate synthase [Chloroflexota bacterium]